MREQILQRAAQNNGAAPEIADLAMELGGVAQLANAAGGAAGCLIAFRSPMGGASVWAADSGVVQPPATDRCAGTGCAMDCGLR